MTSYHVPPVNHLSKGGSDLSSDSPSIPPVSRVYPALGEGTPWLDSYGLKMRKPRRRAYPVELTLPGQGVAEPGCGSPVPYHCPDHEGPFWVRGHCGSRDCPDCYNIWAQKTAIKASIRIAMGAKYVQLNRPGQRVRVVHAVVSMKAPVNVTDLAIDAARALAYAVAKRHGIEGGISVFHATRKEKDEYDEYVPDGYWHSHIIGVNFVDIAEGGPIGALRLVIDDMIVDPASYFSHDRDDAGRFLDGVFIDRLYDAIDRASAVVFKHIIDAEYGDFRGLRSGESITQLLSYLLTHASLEGEDTQAVTYFGCLGYNQLPKAKVHALYPDALEKGSKTNPRKAVACPVDGSRRTELCTPTAWVMTYDSPPSYLEPLDDPTPDAIAQARVELEEDFEFQYRTTADRRERRKLGKERWAARMRLHSRETELFNQNNPLVIMWCWLRAYLSEHEGGVSDIAVYDAVAEKDHGVLDAAINANLKTGRLKKSLRGILTLTHEYGLADALADLRAIVKSGNAHGPDEHLNALLKMHPPADNPVLSDTGFVFGMLDSRGDA